MFHDPVSPCAAAAMVDALINVACPGTEAEQRQSRVQSTVDTRRERTSGFLCRARRRICFVFRQFELRYPGVALQDVACAAR